MNASSQQPGPGGRYAAWFVAGLLFGGNALGAEKPATLLLRDATFEELANIAVTAVSRHEERLFTVPAAMSVLTREAVQATGALSLPEALRTVPGLNVGQISSDAWAIGARGFQWQYANKLLVMIDNRSIYSPLAGGVRWEDNPVFLEDLDRVEVVRGPGSSVWGANAVNGVISIVTRNAFETLGSYLAGGTGENHEVMVAARQGFALSQKTAVRIFGQYQRQGTERLADGSPAKDASRLAFAGMRLDWNPNPQDKVTLQAGWHDRRTEYIRAFATLNRPPDYEEVSTVPVIADGQYATAEWTHVWEDGSTLALRGTYDRGHRDHPQYDETVGTMDLDVIYTSRREDRQLLTAGLGYRFVDSEVQPGYFDFLSTDEHPRLFSGFVQDEITLGADRLKLSLGTKVEHHQRTGWNLQPSVRLTWMPRRDLTVWGAAGRAVRIPTLGETTAAIDAQVYPPGVFDPTLPAVIRVLGNPDLNSEKMTAWEAGVRWKSPAGWSVDVTGFAYRYRDYVLVTPAGTTVQAQPPALVLAEPYRNGINGESYGGELAVGWEPLPGWQLGVSGNFVQIQLHTNLPDPFGFEQDEDTTPHFALMMTSHWRFGRGWSLYCAGRHVEAVKYYAIPAYHELDARLAWQVTDQLEVSLVARNLLDAAHPEYDSALNRRLTELQRNLSLQCEWRY